MNEPTIRPDAERTPAQKWSFLLRVWRTEEAGSSHWRASLDDPHTGQRIEFADLLYLFNYLIELTEGE